MNKPLYPLRPAWLSIFGLGLISGIVYLVNFRLGAFVKTWFPDFSNITAMQIFLLQFLPLYFLYVLGLFVIFTNLQQLGSSRGLLIFIFIAAVLFRVCLIPTPPVLSSDIYRYAWEGRVQIRGMNPYQHRIIGIDITVDQSHMGFFIDNIHKCFNGKFSPKGGKL